jgi:hypothetical protein
LLGILILFRILKFSSRWLAVSLTALCSI